jgi:fumarate hydratase class II
MTNARSAMRSDRHVAHSFQMPPDLEIAIREAVGKRGVSVVAALSPVIGYDKASAITHKASDERLTLKEAALASGDIDEKRFDEIVDPKKMVGHGSRRQLASAKRISSELARS